MKWLLWMALGLSGCQTLRDADGPCQHPPTQLQLGDQTWQESGRRGWEDLDSCLALGGTYHRVNADKAHAQTRVAAEAGNPEAWMQIGRWSLHARPPAYARAEHAFLQAWHRGLDEAAWYLARMARYGLGQVPDPLAATNWLQKASGDQQLVPAGDLAIAKLEARQLTLELDQQAADMAALKTQLKESPRGTPLYRFDLGGQGGCGVDLNWQAFGAGAAGLSLALDAYRERYLDAGWLWLDIGPQPTGPLMDQVMSEILTASPVWLLVTGYRGVDTNSTHPRLFSTQSPAEGGHRYGPTQLSWDCDDV